MFVLDGLGAHNLAARAGHARFLSQASTKRDVARTVFPSTTASALTSLLTGTMPGEHGIVGYRARIPGTDDVVNQLRGWDTDGLPLEWQRADAADRRASELRRVEGGVRRHRVHRRDPPRCRVPRGRRPRRACRARRRPRRAASGILRLPRTRRNSTAIGHRRGWQSDEWVAALERVDAAARTPRRRDRTRHGRRRHRRPRHGRRAAPPPRAAHRRRRTGRRSAAHRRRAADAAPLRGGRRRRAMCSPRGARPRHRGRGCSRGRRRSMPACSDPSQTRCWIGSAT